MAIAKVAIMPQIQNGCLLSVLCSLLATAICRYMAECRQASRVQMNASQRWSKRKVECDQSVSQRRKLFRPVYSTSRGIFAKLSTPVRFAT